MAWHRSKQNNWVRLLKQVEESELESREWGAPEIRLKSFYDTTFDGIHWERPCRNVERSWKNHRKTQYKN